MSIFTEIKLLMMVAFSYLLLSCTTYDTGYSHSCTLVCLNNSSGSEERITRVGKNADYSAVCKETKVTCDAGRSAACTNSADWTSANEPLYSNCSAVDFGTCTPGCALDN
jgi:hypothetical protein